MSGRVDVEVQRFRVEWRAHLTTRWLPLKAVGTREEADRLALQQFRGGFVGYMRIVEQRVVASSLTPRELPTDHVGPRRWTLAGYSQRVEVDAGPEIAEGERIEVEEVPT